MLDLIGLAEGSDFHPDAQPAVNRVLVDRARPTAIRLARYKSRLAHLRLPVMSVAELQWLIGVSITVVLSVAGIAAGAFRAMSDRLDRAYGQPGAKDHQR